jgi:replicative DNA helicase
MRQIVWRASLSNAVLCFTLEVTPDTLIQQLCCEEAKVPFEFWRDGVITDEQQASIVSAMGEFQNRQIKIYAKAKVAALQIGIALAQLRAAGIKPAIVVVDYLGLMDHAKAERNDISIGTTTRALKLMALEQQVSIILLCQLNRESEKRVNGESFDRPRLADLRDSGNIEQDADNIIFLWKKSKDAEDMSIQARILTIAKHRNGRVGDIDVMFDMPGGRFS